MHRAKLIHLGKYYHPVPGGMETHLYDTCNGLRDQFDMDVLVANTSHRTIREVVNGVKVTRVANLGEFFSSPLCPTLASQIGRIKPDADSIIHLHLPNPMAHAAYLLARPAGPLVITWHSDIIRQKKLMALYGRSLMDLLERADCIVATSPNYIRHSHFLRRFERKCVVVPLGIDPDRFRYTERVHEQAQSIRRRLKGPLVLFVGRLTYYKGLEILLKSMQKVDAQLMLIGDGPLRTGLERIAEELQIRHRVHFFTGVSHDELASYYHACDVFVLASNHRSEAFGIVQLEAMICEKPVVSTNLTTGVPWVNRHGVTGEVVPADDPHSLANSLNLLLTRADERRILGQNARSRVLRYFTLERVTSRLSDVYSNVLNGTFDHFRKLATPQAKVWPHATPASRKVEHSC